MVSVFVGEGRKALVQGIVNRLDKLTDSKGDSRACLISLEAPSGWGKTRIIQEVYKQIAERQTSAYWPNTIIPANEDDPISRRKHLKPSFESVPRNRDVLPEFFWWGMNCEMSSTNEPSRSLTNDIDQLRFHAPYLEASWAASRLTRLGKYATVAKAKSALGAVFEEGAVTGLSKLAELGLGATPFGIGLGLKLVTSSAKALKNRKEEHAQMSKGYEDHETIDQGFVDETVNLLARLAHTDLPIIICVEDIHKATEPVLELLAKLLARNAPILMVTTTWPDEFEKITKLKTLLDTGWAQDRIIRMEYDKPTPKGLPEEASLSQLPIKDLSEIILARYPKAEDKAVKLLAERYRNPHPLELVLSMNSLKADYPYLELDEVDVQEFPRSVQEAYAELWNELPKPVQKLLTLSTQVIPEGQSEWLMSLIADATGQLGDEAWTKDISELAENDNIPHGWARVVEGWIRRFGETDQLNIARAYVKDLFGKKKLRLFNEAAAAVIEAFDFSEADIDDAEATHKAWLALAFFNLSKVSLDTNLSASVFLLKSMSDKPLEWNKAIESGEALIDQVEHLSDLTESQAILFANAQFYLAKTYGESGDLIAAKTHYAMCLERRTASLGKDHPDVLTTRNDIARLLGKSGAVSEAIEAFKALLKDRIRVLGPNHQAVLRTRSNHAYWLGESGAVSEPLEAFRALLEDQTRILGPDHTDALVTRSNIASYLGKSESASKALEAFKALLVDQTRILGSDHPYVLTTRSNIAFYLGKSESESKALEAYKVLLVDQTRILGSDHPSVLSARSNIAYCLRACGSDLEAFETVKSLYDDQLRILGPDHPNILITRNNTLSWLRNFGYDTIEAYQLLLEDQTRILGQDHPDVLITRSNIASLLGENGAILEALDRYKMLLEDNTRILGAKHPDVLTTRNNVAVYLAESGAIQAAIEVFKDLVEDQIQILGPDHPDVLITRSKIAAYLEKSGAVSEALEVLSTLLKDQIRILGPDHLDVLTSRDYIAHWFKKNGSLSEALEVIKALFEDLTRIFGSDHPNVLTTRKIITEWLRESGATLEALNKSIALFADQVRILKPEHPDTINTLSNIAYLYRENGNLSDSHDAFEDLLKDQIHTLGPDHPDVLITRSNISALVAEMGSVPDALEMTKALLKDEIRILGSDHPNVLISRGNIACWLGESGATTQALESFQVILEDCNRILGPDHPNTINTQSWISYYQEKSDAQKGE